MPSKTELQETFGGRGPHAATRSIHADLREEERRGRLMRDAQVQDNCTVQVEVPADFGAAEGPVISEWLDFGRVRFVKRPILTSGSMRLALTGEPTLDAEASNFDSALHFAVPCAAQVLRFRTDARGFYSGAKVLLFALDAVPEGFQALVFCLFSGPAVRLT
ncbi:MAG: hypothetical protein ACYC8U_01190 [Thermoleophilia bacterium]